MSLANKISQFRLVVNSTNHDIPVQNMEIGDDLERFTDDVEAVDGTIYPRIAGLRKSVSINYDSNLASSSWRNMINDIITHFVTNGNNSCEFYPDNDNTTSGDKIDVIVSNLEYLIEYRNQIGSFAPSIELKQQTRQTSITSNFEAP